MYAVAPPSIVTLPVSDGRQFPVRRIYCVGRNYEAHAREMGHDPKREEPFFFLKPADAIVPDGSSIEYPQATRQLEHEVELVVALSSGGSNIAVGAASALVLGYAVGIDLTRRDLQSAAKQAGRPWDMGKAFDRSAPCGRITPVSLVPGISDAKIWLRVNGEIRQQSRISQLIWSIPEIIAHLSRYVELVAGDLIYTGTPAGVGLLDRGDTVTANIDGLEKLYVQIA